MLNKYEFKILRFLSAIFLIFLNYHIIFSIFTPLLAPPKFLISFQLTEFFVNLIGLHGFFAFSVFIFSRIYYDLKVKYFILGFSIIAPAIYGILNLHILHLSGFSISYIAIGGLFIFNLMRKDFKYNYLKKYFNILVDPFYLEENDFFSE